MANNPSAKKRNRQRLKRRVRNMQHLSPMRTLVKRARVSLSDHKADGEQMEDAVSTAVSQLAKAAAKGVIHRRTAARKISRLTLALNKEARDRKAPKATKAKITKPAGASASKSSGKTAAPKTAEKTPAKTTRPKKS